jgi:hypothetical protein
MQKQEQAKNEQMKGSCSTEAKKPAGSCGSEMKKDEKMGSCGSDKSKSGSCGG